MSYVNILYIGWTYNFHTYLSARENWQCFTFLPNEYPNLKMYQNLLNQLKFTINGFNVDI